MTGPGSIQQFARVASGIPTYLCRETALPVHSDMIATCSDEEWADLMRAKYGEDFEASDFDLGPANPTLPSMKDRI